MVLNQRELMEIADASHYEYCLKQVSCIFLNIVMIVDLQFASWMETAHRPHWSQSKAKPSADEQ